MDLLLEREAHRLGDPRFGLPTGAGVGHRECDRDAVWRGEQVPRPALAQVVVEVEREAGVPLDEALEGFLAHVEVGRRLRVRVGSRTAAAAGVRAETTREGERRP